MTEKAPAISPLRGFGTVGRALGLFKVRRRLLLMLMLAPWTINLILFLGGWSMLTIWFTGKVDPYLERFVDTWWDPLLTGFGMFLAVVLAGALAYLGTVIAAMVVAAPFHDRLSAAAENAARPGLAPTTHTMGLLRSLAEGGKTALVLLAAEAALLPLHFFPGVGHVLFVFLTALLITVGLLDIPLARREMPLRSKMGFVGRNFGGVFGLSLWVVAVSFIPFLNLLTVPLLVMACTLLVMDGDRVEMPPTPEPETPPLPDARGPELGKLPPGFD